MFKNTFCKGIKEKNQTRFCSLFGFYELQAKVIHLLDSSLSLPFKAFFLERAPFCIALLLKQDTAMLTRNIV